MIDAALDIAGYLAVAGTLPGTTELLLVTTGSLLTPKRRRPHPPRISRLAIIIPAHNEETLIARTVASLAASNPSPGFREIVVVADNCKDATAVRAADAGARVLVRTNLEQRGKGYALRFGFDTLLAEGFDAFLVDDADSIVSPNLVSETVQRLNEGAAAVQCRYRVANGATSIRTRLMDVAFLAFNVLRPRGRSGWGLSSGVLGNGWALRSETLRAVPYNADSIVEDLEYHIRLVMASEPIDFINEASVYGEIPDDDQAARVQRSRWEGGRLRMAKEWAPRIAKSVLGGNASLIEPLLELLTLPLAYHVSLLLFAFAIPGSHRLFAVAGLAVVAAHVTAAAAFGDQPWKTLFALIAAPFYILWKLTTLEAVFSASRRNASWVRTGRDQDVGLKPAK